MDLDALNFRTFSTRQRLTPRLSAQLGQRAVQVLSWMSPAACLPA